MKAELIVPPQCKDVVVTMTEEQAKTIKKLLGKTSISNLKDMWHLIGYTITSDEAGVFHCLWDVLSQAEI